MRHGKRIAETKKVSSLLQIILSKPYLAKFLNKIPIKVQCLFHDKVVLHLFRWKSCENYKILAFLHWPCDATKTCKNISTRERLSVTIRFLQGFYSTVLFSICNTHVTEHITLKYWSIWRNFIQEIKKSY